MYNPDRFQVPNEDRRFALRDPDPLRYHPDGSLDIVVGGGQAWAGATANWLPAPAGPFALFLELLCPANADALLDGRWQPPPVRVHHRSRSYVPFFVLIRSSVSYDALGANGCVSGPTEREWPEGQAHPFFQPQPSRNASADERRDDADDGWSRC